MPNIGIDFGTTNSSLVAYDKASGKFTYFHWEGIIPKPIPSVVWYHDNIIEVGRKAKDNFNTYCDMPGHHLEKSVKSKLGKDTEIPVFGKLTKPYLIAAEIIKKLKGDAIMNKAEQAGIELHRAVFTCPVNFSGQQRQDLRSAANEAGIDVACFIHEPFAAVVGYLYKNLNGASLKEFDGKYILVFDWGGGTLDITVVKIDGTKLLESGTAELTGQAGDKFDEDLADWCCNRFRDKYSGQFDIEFINEKLSAKKDRILSECEQAKIKLSTDETAEILVEEVIFVEKDGQRLYFDIDEKITRSEFASCIERHINGAINQIKTALTFAGISKEQIECVLLTGGSSHICAVVDTLKNMFGYKVKPIWNYDMVISEGAAVVSEMQWLPYLAKNIMVELCDGSFWIAFEAGTPLTGENSKKEIFTCVDKRDNYAKLIIAEGTKRYAKDKNLGVLNVPMYKDRLPMPPLLPRTSIENIDINNARIQNGEPDDINVNLRIDGDAVLEVRGHSIYEGRRKTMYIYDICFGLDLQ